MTDIAQLGMMLDTAQIVRGRTELDALVPAAARVQQATDKMTESFRRAGAESVKLRTLQQSINSGAGVRDDFGSASRARDIAIYGQQLDNLRAKYNPLFAAGRQYKQSLDEINFAARVGALSENERITAMARTKSAFTEQVASIRGVTSASEGHGRAMSYVRGSVMGVVSALGIGNIAALGFGGALAIGAVKAVTEFKRLELEQQTYEAVLRATSQASGKTGSDIEAMAESIARASLSTEGDVRGAASQMLLFRNVSGETFNEAMKLSADLAAVTGDNMRSAADTIGRALENPEEGLIRLRRAGIMFSESTKLSIKNLSETGQQAQATRIILDELQKRVGGAAGAQADTLSGAFHQLGEATNNWLESAGQSISRAFGLQGAIRGIANAMDEVNKRQQDREKNAPQTAVDTARANLDLLLNNPNRGRGRPGITRDQQIEAAQRNLAMAEHAATLQRLTAEDEKLVASSAEFAASEATKRDAIQGAIAALELEIGTLSKSTIEREIEAEMRKRNIDVTTAEGRARAAAVEALVRERHELQSGTSDLQRRLSILGNLASVEEQMALKRREINDFIREGGSLSSTEQTKLLERARVTAEMSTLEGQIAFEARQLLRTTEEQAIAQRLVAQGIRDSDENMKGLAANAMRANENMRQGQEALSGLGQGLTSAIRSGQNLKEWGLNKLFSLSDKMFDRNFDAFVKQMTAPGQPLNGVAGLLGGALNPQTTATMNVSATMVNVNGGAFGAGGGSPIPFMGSNGLPTGTPAIAPGTFNTGGSSSSFLPSTNGMPAGFAPGATFRAAQTSGFGANINTAAVPPQALAAAQSVSASTGMPLGQVLSVMKIESSFNANAVTPSGTYGGLFQLNQRTLGPGVFDPSQAAGMASTQWQGNISAFQQQFGRMPSGSEMYMMHQQGQAGAFQHFSNPGGLAWQNFKTASGASDSFSQKAIWGNMTPEMKSQFPGGVGDVTSGQFTGMWQQKFEGVERSLTGVSTSATQASTAFDQGGASAIEFSGGLGDATGGLGQFTQGLSSVFQGGGGISGGGGFNFGGLFSGGGGGGGFEAGTGFFGVQHEGGLVSSPRSFRYAPFALWANAPRFHAGGVGGLSPDERAIIVKDTEEVLTDRDPRHRKNSGRGGTTIHNQFTINTPNADSILKSRGQIARTLGRAQQVQARHQ